MNIVLLGAPASGKGTQAELLAKKFKLYHFQTGELARKLSESSPRIKKIVASGALIPEEEMTMYAISHLSKQRSSMKNILFEGFPRFISQYQALSEFLKSIGDDIDAIIFLEIGQKEAIKRLSARRTCAICGRVYNLVTNPPKKMGICGKCGGTLVQRDDDKPSSIKTRFDFYRQNTKALMEYLDKKGLLTRVDGERPIEEIQKDLVETLKKVEKGLQI